MRVKRRWRVAPAILFSLTLLALSSQPTVTRVPSAPRVVTESSLMPVVLATPAPAVIVDGPSLAPATPSVSDRAGIQPNVRAVPEVSLPSVGDARAWARSRIGARQFRCLDLLWTRESNWNPRARNKSSGAYGIPQALPGEKMAKAGDDWKYNPLTQVKWGLSYIKARYGTACAAWQHSEDVGWY